jgi:anti-sigma factor RsiW
MDWPLDAAEAAWLDGHLAGCKACRRRAAEFQ